MVMAKTKLVTLQTKVKLVKMGQLARKLMRTDEEENYDAYVAMGEVQLNEESQE